MIIDYSESGPLSERFKQDNIESILESGDPAIEKYFEGLKQEGKIFKYENAYTSRKYITFHTHSTGFGKLLIR